jgi:hypothetical protein
VRFLGNYVNMALEFVHRNIVSKQCKRENVFWCGIAANKWNNAKKIPPVIFNMDVRI